MTLKMQITFLLDMELWEGFLEALLRRQEKQGIKVGLFRPITLWPFPYDELKRAARGKKFCTVVEMSTGQMVEDVRLSVEGSLPVHFYGRTGGMVPTLTKSSRNSSDL